MIYILVKISVLLYLILISLSSGCLLGGGIFDPKRIILVEKVGFCNSKESPKEEDWRKCQM